MVHVRGHYRENLRPVVAVFGKNKSTSFKNFESEQERQKLIRNLKLTGWRVYA